MAVSMTNTASNVEQRKIVHVDMDSFFASVEQRDDPRLKGQPVCLLYTSDAADE